MYRWLITGANGNLGRRLLGTLLAQNGHAATAVVRSGRARDQIMQDAAIPSASESLQVRVVDYEDADALADAAAGCDRAVHLVGHSQADARRQLFQCARGKAVGR